MTTASAAPRRRKVPDSTVRLARSLVRAAQREGRRVEADIEAVARMPLPEDVHE